MRTFVLTTIVILLSSFSNVSNARGDRLPVIIENPVDLNHIWRGSITYRRSIYDSNHNYIRTIVSTSNFSGATRADCQYQYDTIINTVGGNAVSSVHCH